MNIQELAQKIVEISEMDDQSAHSDLDAVYIELQLCATEGGKAISGHPVPDESAQDVIANNPILIVMTTAAQQCMGAMYMDLVGIQTIYDMVSITVGAMIRMGRLTINYPEDGTSNERTTDLP